MARTTRTLSRRGRPPSLAVAARRTNRLQREVKHLLYGLEDLEKRLVRLDDLMVAGRKAMREKVGGRAGDHPGIRGKGPNVRDVAYQVLAKRRRPMNIQELSRRVLRLKKGSAGGNFTQNLGAALARDSRFTRAGRGLYTIKKR